MTAKLNELNGLNPLDQDASWKVAPNDSASRINDSSTSPNRASNTSAVDPARRIQGLIEQVEQFPNPAARTLMHECIASLLAMYGEGLEHVLGILNKSRPNSDVPLSELLEDPLVRSLLLIHGLHPVNLETRLKQALDTVRPYMQSHGGNVEVIELVGEFARLRLKGACQTCPSSRITLELAVRKALEDHCPDLAGFEVETA